MWTLSEQAAYNMANDAYWELLYRRGCYRQLEVACESLFHLTYLGESFSSLDDMQDAFDEDDQDSDRTIN